MQFTRRLHDGIRDGTITTTIRIWQKPHVKVGGCYKLGDGVVKVESIMPISLSDITPALARQSGFEGVIDLLKTAKHGSGTNVYLLHFHYLSQSEQAHDQD